MRRYVALGGLRCTGVEEIIGASDRMVRMWTKILSSLFLLAIVVCDNKLVVLNNCDPWCFDTGSGIMHQSFLVIFELYAFTGMACEIELAMFLDEHFAAGVSDEDVSTLDVGSLEISAIVRRRGTTS